MQDGLHLAVIPDGNRRWADENGYAHREGHRRGADKAEELVEYAEDDRIEAFTIWALSQDNAKKRSERELQHLNQIIANYADRLNRPDSAVHTHRTQITVIGDRSVVSPRTRERLAQLEADTADYDGKQFSIAIGYDGRYDIVQAANTAFEERGGPVDRADIEDYLLLDEPDIVLGYGADRVNDSNYTNWWGYATEHYPEKNWPDADFSIDLEDAIALHEERKKTRGR